MASVSVPETRKDILASVLRNKELSTQVDLPLSAQSREALAFANDEAKQFAHRHVSNSHILLGLLSGGNSRIAQLLGARGVLADRVRSEIGGQEDNRTAGEDESLGASSLATGPPFPPGLRSLMFTTIPQVKELTRRGEQRGALKLLDDLMAEPVAEKNLRIRHLAPLATATARSIRDFHLAKRYCELRLAEDPDDVMALYEIADCLMQQGDLDEARTYATRCYELGSARGDAIGLGVVELLQTRFPEFKLGS